MLRIFHGTSYDFIKHRKVAGVITALFIVPGLLLAAIAGFNYSIEFTGGTLVQLRFDQPQQPGDIRAALGAVGIEGAEIQSFGSASEYAIRAQEADEVAQQASGAATVSDRIVGALDQRFGEGSYEVVRTEAVGPKVGSELRQRAILAMLLSFLVTLVYLAWRFEWRFGVAAVIATAHDFLATVAFIRYLDIEVSLVAVGAILTVIGYSLNDTIVIFDRIRENLRKRRKEGLYETINRSVNEVLPRTLLTGPTSLATLLSLLIFGGEVIRPFALIMTFGIIVGTFSSIYVAAPILLYIERRWPRELGDHGGIVPRTAIARDAKPSRETAERAAGDRAASERVAARAGNPARPR